MHNSTTNGPICTKLGWLHPIMPPTCLPRCGCHGNGHSLATVHWTFSSYGHLEVERVNQFWWHFVRNSKLGTHVSHDQILKNSRWQLAAIPEHVGNAITRLPMDRFWTMGLNSEKTLRGFVLIC